MQSDAHWSQTDVLYHLKDELGEHWIDETTIERDLGIQVENNLKPSAQCVKAAAKARSILGMISRETSED